jgi:IS30 family transposase
MTHHGQYKTDPAQMDTFWQHRSTGDTTAHAAHTAGISRAAAQEILHRTGGIRPRTRPAATGRFLSAAEREDIALGWAAGHTPAQIARHLGRHRATISRELHRNQTRDHHTGQIRRHGIAYRASTAHWQATRRAARPKPAKLATDATLRAWVAARLAQYWSPRQIAATTTTTFPDQPEMWVSHETIYQALYVQSRGGLRRELTACLRTGRVLRRPRTHAGRPVRARFPDMVMISERPAEVADRAVPGHWEGDLIMGRANRSAIGTLVERSTRFCLLLHLPDGHHPDQVGAAMLAQMGRLPALLRRSLTWDQGGEMAGHARISMALEMPVFFCDPHSPWQRGTNENTNGLLRQYFPKGTPLAVHTSERLDFVAAQLNGRPRETLGWDTPAQRLNQLLLR